MKIALAFMALMSLFFTTQSFAFTTYTCDAEYTLDVNATTATFTSSEGSFLGVLYGPNTYSFSQGFEVHGVNYLLPLLTVESDLDSSIVPAYFMETGVSGPRTDLLCSLQN